MDIYYVEIMIIEIEIMQQAPLLHAGLSRGWRGEGGGPAPPHPVHEHDPPPSHAPAPGLP